ncbi:MAG TPA: primosomal protein N' [Candidatus Dormibacteraeota bacterium]|nr:primosomal protein N' [Candidatus Dormibacteraeota bacterium]
MTYYYDIWVSTKQFRSSSTLTYSSDKKLNTGNIVLVPFRNKIVLGVIKSSAITPNFKTRSIDNQIHKKSLPKATIRLLEWLMRYYPSTSSTHLQLFVPNSVAKIEKGTIKNAVSSNIHKKIAPKLTKEQALAIETIDRSESRSFLIHGNTGSGKTRIYIELIKNTVSKSKSAIVLVPEIGLSPQIAQSIEDYFPGKVIVMNSGLSEKTKRENWNKILTSVSPIIVVGPRSALFTPVNNLGLIVIDEAHDTSYKQDSAPFYQTTRVAAKLSEITNSKLVMGTASPLVSDYYLFKQKNIPIIRMVKPALPYKIKNKPQIEIIDIADKSLFTKSSWLSDKILESVRISLENNEQSLIFLNRRGTASSIICQNCGWKALCSNCNTSMTYHADHHQIICHSCGYKQKSPSRCPKCNSHDIIYKGVGTKAIEAELKKIFPFSNIKRFDKDNLVKDKLEKNYLDISQGNTDIIIGTQIITKGLDLPKLTTVGIVMADQNLAFPDFSSDEKSFQILLQVIGRVGRGHQDSNRIIIQTFDSDGAILNAAISKDYDIFYNNQLYIRKKYLFPPFVFMLKIYCKKNNASTAKNECLILINQIRELNLATKISDPVPAFHEKVNNKYVWQFVVKSKNRQNLLDIISKIPSDWFYDIDPANLL